MTKETIRRATATDAQVISQLVNSVYRGDSSRKGWTTEADLISGERIRPNQVVDIIGQDNQVILVAEVNDQIIGCVQLKRYPDKAYLGMLSVSASIQAKGLGSRILSYCEEFVKREWNSPEMFMWVLTFRVELINWYLRKGYKMTDERVPYSATGSEGGQTLVEGLEFAILTKNL